MPMLFRVMHQNMVFHETEDQREADEVKRRLGVFFPGWKDVRVEAI